MKSQGTKATQGINGDAAMLQHKLAAAANATTGDGAACPYPDHRVTDWRLSIEHPAVCGVCHPAPAGLTHELVAVSPATAGQEVPAHAA